MLSMRRPVIALGVLDAAITYLWAFGVQAIPLGRSGPHAPWSFWVTQPWVYALILPVSLVVAWRGARDVQSLHEGLPQAWWRLPAEGIAVTVTVVLVLGHLTEMSLPDVTRSAGECAVLVGMLGAILALLHRLIVKPNSLRNAAA